MPAVLALRTTRGRTSLPRALDIVERWHEAVQLYVAGGSGEGAPVRSLRGFERIRLKAGEVRRVRFVVQRENLARSAVEISVGGGQLLAGIPHVKGTV